MLSTELPETQTTSHAKKTIVFLYLLAGGTGMAAYEIYRTLCRSSSEKSRAVLLDPDGEYRKRSRAHHKPTLQFNESIVDALRANAALFGPYIEKIFHEMQGKLDASDICNGMRAIRPLSQLLFAYYYDRIAEEISKAVDHLRGPWTIQPVIVSSTGGGTGSALSVLLLEALGDTHFRDKIMLGIPKVVLSSRPLMFVAEPFAYARKAKPLMRKKLLSNMFAFRIETDWLLGQGAAQYIFHLGFSNAYGTTITTGEQMAQVLGTTIYMYQSCYEVLKGQHVNYADEIRTTERYSGLDFVTRVRNEFGWFE